MRKLFGVLVAAVALMAFSLPVFAQDEVPTIAEVVVASATGESPEFTTLLAAVQAADPAVLEALSNPEASLTVFAPTDAAFAALGEETLNAVLADQAMLTDILLFHVLGSQVMSTDVVAGLEGGAFSTATLQGQYIDVAQTDMGITINGANLVTVDITAPNGVIHVIDAVILPETRTIAEIVVDLASMEEGAEFTSLLAAVQAADPAVLEALSDSEAELTVFAPTDAAFAALGEETLNAVLADQ
ncbi:MAG: adhesion lipoprotein, partial [Phototrophicales bacterium]